MAHTIPKTYKIGFHKLGQSFQAWKSVSGYPILGMMVIQLKLNLSVYPHFRILDSHNIV